MLNDKTYIAQIGLNDADLRLVETLFKLSAELRESYKLDTGKPHQDTDIVLLNAESAEALEEWSKHDQWKQRCTLIKLTSADDNATDELVISRPLSLKKVMVVLEQATSRHVNKTVTSNSSENRKRVLVVDDSFSVRSYMEHKLPQLSEEPLHIEFADSGEAAIDKMNTGAFDLVFLDVVMPGKDGYQVCKWIKSEQPAYVVMLTSKKSPFDKVRGNMSGCNAYITKPPKDEQLQRVLTKGLAENRNKGQSGLLGRTQMMTS